MLFSRNSHCDPQVRKASTLFLLSLATFFSQLNRLNWKAHQVVRHRHRSSRQSVISREKLRDKVWLIPLKKGNRNQGG